MTRCLCLWLIDMRICGRYRQALRYRSPRVRHFGNRRAKCGFYKPHGELKFSAQNPEPGSMNSQRIIMKHFRELNYMRGTLWNMFNLKCHTKQVLPGQLTCETPDPNHHLVKGPEHVVQKCSKTASMSENVQE